MVRESQGKTSNEDYSGLSKDELIHKLDELDAALRLQGEEDEGKRLLQELQIYQIELEMQNQELREAQAKMEASRDRLSDLYDFAPVGYLTLDEKGKILEANITAANMLGVERIRLVGSPMTAYVSQARTLFNHIRHCCERSGSVVAEFGVNVGDQGERHLQFTSVASRSEENGALIIRMAMTDVSERKLGEEALEKVLHLLESGQALAPDDTGEQERVVRELQAVIKKVESFSHLATGREMRMIELKREVNALLKELGREEKYAVYSAPEISEFRHGSAYRR